jgi:pyrroline-5-carboxylate reductase
MAAQGFQTIIKLKDRTVDVRSRSTLERLSRAAGARIEYVRPMSGDAHVVRVVPIAPATYEQALQDLRGSELFEYVEHDALVQPQGQR